MMPLISIVFFLIGFVSFFTFYRFITLIVVCILSTNYFGFADLGFILGSLSLQHGDLALLLIFILIPFRTINTDNQFINIKKVLVLFLIFLSISILYDYLIRGTSPIQIFRTTRKAGYLAFFFLIYSFDLRDYKIFIKILIFITILHSLLYISQYLMGYTLKPSGIIMNELGGARYRYAPVYIIPVLIICLFTRKFISFFVYLILFLTVIILTQTRGTIISAICVIFLFLLFKKIHFSVLISYIILFLLIYTFTINYFPIIKERFLNFGEEIKMVNAMDYNNLSSFYHNGSFIFRIGVTYERLIYVLKEPASAVLGVGFTPDLDIQRPIFTLGTFSPSLPSGFEQYNSADILFPNIITRYGIVGSLLFLYLIYSLFKFSLKSKDTAWGKILFTYLVAMIILSFISDTFYNGQSFLIIFIIMGITSLYTTKSNNPNNFDVRQIL